MGLVTYIQPDGTADTVEVPNGITLMDGAVAHNVAGILAECGGSCSCGTCHVHVGAPWLNRVGEPDPSETELVEFMDGREEDSRLACQILMTDELDGITVRIPDHEG